MTTRNKEKCPICELPLRSDIVVRHLLNHRHNLGDWMTQDAIKKCIDTKYPLAYRKVFGHRELCFGVCLICKKGRIARSRMGDFVEWEPVHQKGVCKKRWDEVAQYFTSAVKDSVILVKTPESDQEIHAVTVEPPTRPTLVLQNTFSDSEHSTEVTYVSAASESQSDEWETRSSVSCTPDEYADMTNPKVRRIYRVLSDILEQKMHYKEARREYREVLDDLRPDKDIIGKAYKVLEAYIEDEYAEKDLEHFLATED